MAVPPNRTKLYIYTSKDMMVALIAATTDSLAICLNVSLASKELLASPCTIIAEDWVPTFPPVPPIRGMYSAISGCAAKVASKLPNIMELPIPPSIPISNHGRRAEVWRMTLSSVSTSCDKPDANWATRKRAEFCAKNIQLIVSSCQAASDRLFRRAFLYHGEILKCGMPRNDFLVCGNTEQADQKVRQTYQIDRKYRILLYAPTYRSNGKNQMPDFTGLRKVLEENGEKWYVLYRAHRYSEDDSAGLDPECSADVTDYPDMQELLAAADMLITDYSSCIWDYSFLYRPCFLYTPDLREYLAKTGFYVDIHEWPFPICENMEDLEKQIRSFDEEKNRARIMEHHQQMGSYESGHACEAVCSWIKQKSICEENV